MNKPSSSRIVAFVTVADATSRMYFEPTAEGDVVAVWTKDSGIYEYRTDRFNGGVFNRNWIREAVSLATVTF